MMIIRIKNKAGKWDVPEGKPVIVRWRGKNKSRPGVSVGIGWLKRGEKPQTVRLVHQAFSTYDKAENEYASSWTVWYSQITDVRLLASTQRC